MDAFDECVRPVPSYIFGIYRPVSGSWRAAQTLLLANRNGAGCVFSKM